MEPKQWHRVWWWVIVAVLYLVTAIPLGMGLYSLKSWLGWNVSAAGGFHSFQRCMMKETQLFQQTEAASRR